MRRVWVVGIVVVVVLLLPLLLSRLKGPQESGTTPPERAEKGQQPAAIEPASPALQQWLKFAPGTVSVEIARDIRQVTTDWANMASVFVQDPQFRLTFQIDPEVQASVTGRWRKTPMKTILDEVCSRNKLKWEVAGPNTIRISVRE